MASVACPRCGTGNAESDSRCSSCGAELAMFAATMAGPPSPPSARSLPGDSLVGSKIGHYLVEDPLGGGGMGVVYRALDDRLRRPAALKVLAPSLTHDPVARARFEREARAVSGLDPFLKTDIFGR